MQGIAVIESQKERGAAQPRGVLETLRLWRHHPGLSKGFEMGLEKVCGDRVVVILRERALRADIMISQDGDHGFCAAKNR